MGGVFVLRFGEQKNEDKKWWVFMQLIRLLSLLFYVWWDEYVIRVGHFANVSFSSVKCKGNKNNASVSFFITLIRFLSLSLSLSLSLFSFLFFFLWVESVHLTKWIWISWLFNHFSITFSDFSSHKTTSEKIDSWNFKKSFEKAKFKKMFEKCYIYIYIYITDF